MGLAERGVISPHRRDEKTACGVLQAQVLPRHHLHGAWVCAWSCDGALCRCVARGGSAHSTRARTRAGAFCLAVLTIYCSVVMDGWLADTGVRGDFFAPHNICAHSDGPIGKRLRLLPASAFLNSHTSRWLAMVFDGPRFFAVDGMCYNGATMLLWRHLVSGDVTVNVRPSINFTCVIILQGGYPVRVCRDILFDKCLKIWRRHIEDKSR